MKKYQKGFSLFGLLFWGFIIFAIILPMFGININSKTEDTQTTLSVKIDDETKKEIKEILSEATEKLKEAKQKVEEKKRELESEKRVTKDTEENIIENIEENTEEGGVIIYQ